MEGLSGTNWKNIFSDTLSYGSWLFPNGVPDFSHTTNGWDSFAYHPLYTRFRFTYITDISTMPRDGWMIDNFTENFAHDGISTTSIPNTFNAYPIPATQYLTITYSKHLTNDAHLNIYDMTWRLAATFPVLQASTTVPLSELASGIYVCELDNGEDKVYRRIVVTR